LKTILADNSTPDREKISTSNLVIRNVGLDDSAIQRFFRLGAGPEGTTMVEGIPNVRNIPIGPGTRENFTLIGNGNLSVRYICTACAGFGGDDRTHFSSLTVSGLSNMTRDRNLWSVHNLSAETFRAVNNTFKSISLDFENITSLYMIGNPHLSQINFRFDAVDYAWSDIQISGNPELRMKSAKNFENFMDFDYDTKYGPSIFMKPVFIWPKRNTSSMVFEGPFDNAFL
jgi:hypothetical protein